MKELTEQSATALPLPYGALFIHETQNMALAEEIAHDTLDRYRINPYREFFEVDLQFAKLVVSRACQIADGIDVEMPTVPRIEKLSPPPEPMPISSPAAPITTPDIDSHIKNYLLVIFTLARIARSSLIWLLSCCWLLVIHKYGFTKLSFQCNNMDNPMGMANVYILSFKSFLSVSEADMNTLLEIFKEKFLIEVFLNESNSGRVPMNMECHVNVHGTSKVYLEYAGYPGNWFTVPTFAGSAFAPVITLDQAAVDTSAAHLNNVLNTLVQAQQPGIY